jgi:hypothetical protein
MRLTIAPSSSKGARPFGLVVGALGGLLVLVSSFLEWLPADPTSGDAAYPYSTPEKLALILGIAILCGIGISWVWEHLSSGAIFSTVLSGIILFTAVGGTGGMATTSGKAWSVGFYLLLSGALLAFLGSLITLATRLREAPEEQPNE